MLQHSHRLPVLSNEEAETDTATADKAHLSDERKTILKVTQGGQGRNKISIASITEGVTQKHKTGHYNNKRTAIKAARSNYKNRNNRSRGGKTFCE